MQWCRRACSSSWWKVAGDVSASTETLLAVEQVEREATGKMAGTASGVNCLWKAVCSV